MVIAERGCLAANTIKDAQELRLTLAGEGPDGSRNIVSERLKAALKRSSHHRL
jgi:hypothetical protein